MNLKLQTKSLRFQSSIENKLDLIIKTYFAQFNSKSSGSINNVILGKMNYQTLPGNSIIVQIPYYTTGAVIPFSKWNALGIAITRVINYPVSKNHLPNPVFNTFEHEHKHGNNLGAKAIEINDWKIELRLVQLQYPYLDSFILSQYVALNACKYNFARIHKRIFKNVSPKKANMTSLPSYITGMKMELAGRLTTQRSIPRKTVSNKHTGSLHGSSKNIGNYASKNKIGAYTMKVWLSES